MVQGLVQSLASLTLSGYPDSYITTSSALLPRHSFTRAAEVLGSAQVWNVTLKLPGLAMTNATGQHMSLWSLPDMLLSPNASLAAPLLHVFGASVSPICGDGQCSVGEASIMQTALTFDSEQGVSAAAANTSNWVTNLNEVVLDQSMASAPSGAGSLVSLHSPWHCSADCPNVTVCVPPTQRAQLAYALAVAHDGGWFGDDALPRALNGWQQAASSIVHLHVAVRCRIVCADIMMLIIVGMMLLLSSPDALWLLCPLCCAAFISVPFCAVSNGT